MPYDDLSIPETEWRAELKKTLIESLNLLRTALSQYAEKWPQCIQQTTYLLNSIESGSVDCFFFVDKNKNK
jgi:hypothetical protein